MILLPGKNTHLKLVVVVLSSALCAQVLPPGFNRPTPPPKPQQQPPAPAPNQAKPTPAKPAPANPASPAPAQGAAQQPAPAQTAPPVTSTGGLNLQNASLTEVIDILARQMKINYILDPRVKGGVTINTYGETKNIDSRELLDMILRINGAAMVQVGDIYRIVPLADVQRLPGLKPEMNSKPVDDDDRAMLNLLFLKYATVDELSKLLEHFLDPFGKMWSFPAANLLMIQDTRRNMRRLMDLVSQFDSDTFANQRVRLFEVKNGRPTDVVKELEGILKSISLNEKSSPVRLMPVDRINTVIAVAPNPGVFSEVEKWLRKLDTEPKILAGSIENFVYRVKYGRADMLAMAIMQLYGYPVMGMGMGMMGGYGGMGMGGYGGGMYGGGMGMGGYGGGGMYGGGMGMGGYGGGGMYGGGMGMGGYGGGYPGGGGYGSYVAPPQAGLPVGMAPNSTPGVSQPGIATAAPAPDLTGQYLGAGTVPGGQPMRAPRIIPNPMDNTLLIQSTRQEYEGIVKLLRELDIPPRQVLVEAKIYEVDLTGALASGVSAFLQRRGNSLPSSDNPGRSLLGSLSAGAVDLSVGALVGQSRELLAFLRAQEQTTKARVISAPSLIATDSIPAIMNVGTEVPTLTAQAVTGAQSQGSSLFANSVQNRNSGVTLNVMARVNPSGVVTLVINQEVSAPIPPAATAAIQSPSFSKRTVQTQVTLQDGDTIAIGGIINESNTNTSAGIPFLHRIPVVGAAFGNRSYSRERTELIIFLTPRVVYDMNDLADASDELKTRVRQLRKYIRD